MFLASKAWINEIASKNTCFLSKHRITIRSNGAITDISMITLEVYLFQNETFKGALRNGIPKNFKKVLCKTSLKRSSIVKKDLVADTFLRLSLNI